MKVVIVGATSGLGRELATLFIRDGHYVGLVGRNMRNVDDLKRNFPDQVQTKQIDVNDPMAPQLLTELIEAMGGMDLYFHASGIGHNNPMLEAEVECQTVATNCSGFTAMIDCAFHYFEKRGKGHIAAITSVAGIKGLGVAPAYSASKRFQMQYLQSLAQLSRIKHLQIDFTDIRPGFVATEMLKNKNYPLMLRKERVTRQIYRAVIHKRRVKTIDWKFAIIVSLWKIIPNRVWEWLRVQ